MAKIKKLYPPSKNKEPQFPTFEKILAEVPEEVANELKANNVNSFEELLGYMLINGIDPLKVAEMPEEKLKSGNVSLDDVRLDEDSYGFDDDDNFYDDDYDEDEDDFDDDDYMFGFSLPEKKFIGTSKREFHIRVKLNDAPVKIWRELVVPSNITLELLAYVIIDAMGWGHEHLYQFIGKNNTYYINSRQMKEANDFFSFFSPVQNVNSEKTTLEMVLQPKGGRIKFEYDFGDSWIHDLWVKGARDYASGEEPVIKLLKAQGACPPEDCGGVWGYADLLELKKKKRKSSEDKKRLDWYVITKDYNPEDADFEELEDSIESLWYEIKEKMKEEEKEKEKKEKEKENKAKKQSKPKAQSKGKKK